MRKLSSVPRVSVFREVPLYSLRLLQCVECACVYNVQGGIESEEDYPYCSGFGKCFPCAAPGYNKTRCGPAAPYCLKNESCSFKLERSKFVPGLNLSSWVAISKVYTYA